MNENESKILNDLVKKLGSFELVCMMSMISLELLKRIQEDKGHEAPYYTG
jgi:hypothetical protein